jgi:hypothetical protein
VLNAGARERGRIVFGSASRAPERRVIQPDTGGLSGRANNAQAATGPAERTAGHQPDFSSEPGLIGSGSGGPVAHSATLQQPRREMTGHWNRYERAVLALGLSVEETAASSAMQWSGQAVSEPTGSGTSSWLPSAMTTVARVRRNGPEPIRLASEPTGSAIDIDQQAAAG